MPSIAIRRLSVLLGIALLLILGALPATSHAQATRTWVSGVGDDANPCSRTAPCKTFAGAISKTAANGEINCLDPAGFGAVVITKSIKIDCTGTLGSILAAGTTGVTITAGTGDLVILRGLSINGVGTGTNGIQINSAGHVRVENVEIRGMTTRGINSVALAKLTVLDSQVRDIGQFGIHLAGGQGSSTLISGSVVSGNNSAGIKVLNGNFATIVNTVVSHNGANGIIVVSTGDPTEIYLAYVTSTSNTTGLYVNGSNARALLSNSVFTHNTALGISTVNAGNIISLGGNRSAHNFGGDGAPTETLTPF